MSDYCVCKDCGCKHLVWEKSCPYCRRIAELEAEVAELEKTIAVIKDITLDGELSWKEKHKWISKEVDDE